MGRHNFGYFFREGLTNMVSHGFRSFAAVGITVACLLIMGTFSLVAVNADAQLTNMEESNEILAYVDETYTDEEARSIQSKIEAVPGVISATFISREEALTAFVAKYPDEALFQDLDPTILRDRYAIRVSDLEHLRAIRANVEAVEGVAEVNAYEIVADGLITVRRIATVICLTLIAILFFVSVFIISNTIKLTTFDRKDEIAIMKMVGATNGFIRWPFVYEGFLLGICGAVAAFFLQWGLYELIARGIARNDTLQLIDVLPFSGLWPYVAVIFAAAGLLIGVGGSLSAIRRFLQV
ncbi:MAG: permease-like cell division protein FtsX [Oscillibacter sp.]|nr:permease-like cell division protein FtsX [Oscillibacter sp.]